MKKAEHVHSVCRGRLRGETAGRVRSVFYWQRRVCVVGGRCQGNTPWQNSYSQQPKIFRGISGHPYFIFHAHPARTSLSHALTKAASFIDALQPCNLFNQLLHALAYNCIPLCVCIGVCLQHYGHWLRCICVSVRVSA